jgi:hypothetical protein
MEVFACRLERRDIEKNGEKKKEKKKEKLFLLRRLILVAKEKERALAPRPTWPSSD